MTATGYTIPDIRYVKSVISKYIFNNKSYNFEFKWNTRSEDINLTVSLVNNLGNETLLITNINVVPGINLMQYYIGEDFEGYLFIFDDTGNFKRPTYHNFHKDFIMVFLTEDELE